MPRDLPLGNGDLLVTFDHLYQARDIYYPFVGKYNHSVGYPQRFGVWTPEHGIRWSDHACWSRSMKYRKDTLVGEVTLESPELNLRVNISECVDFHESAWLRKVVVTDLTPQKAKAASSKDPLASTTQPTRDIRIFVHADLSIQETPVGDTCNYDPESHGLVLYKGDFYFLLSGCTLDAAGKGILRSGIDDWAIGSKRIGGAEGTWRDAEDGALGKNAIAQGSVDGTAAIHLKVPHGSSATGWTWLVCGKDYESVLRIHRAVCERTPEKFLSRTDAYWKLWSRKERTDTPEAGHGGSLSISPLPEDVCDLYTRSLLVLRTQIDNRGAIIAANDSDITHFAGDTYSYCWPRDGALVAYGLQLAGQAELSREFFRFCAKCINKNGYFLHKYTPDGKLASSWHPWTVAGEGVLPVQQDETALVLWSLRQHFLRFRDVEFVKPLYTTLVVGAAKWMVDYRDEHGLPKQSWDLWEERRGIHTFTVAATYAALMAASDFATDFGDLGRAKWFRDAAVQMKDAALEHLWNAHANQFARLAKPKESTPSGKSPYDLDMTRDSANFAAWWLGLVSPTDPRALAEVKSLRETLWCQTDVGGMARYENDYYHRVIEGNKQIPGNPWIICTLWHAQHIIATAQTVVELNKARDILQWTAKRCLPSGVVAEQVHPISGAPLSVSPLTWSHATVVIVVHEYLQAYERLVSASAHDTGQDFSAMA